MDEQGQDYNVNSQGYTNFQAMQSASTLQLRLDTQPFLDMMENFLRSVSYIQENENGKVVVKKVSFGKPLANEEGIRWILQRLNALINAHVAQGNYNDDRYDRDVWMIRTSLAYNIMTNLYNWEIRDENYHMIIDTIMDCVKPFLSRTLYNEERKSYGVSMQTREVNTIQPPAKSGLGGLFKF